MSKALDYLIAARPEAMTAYFSFLKKADEHLDTKTRDLISVITKVAVQTEGGFRQYLTRALRNGATPDEVIDALLTAFPVLGLAKIVWAVDLLLAMDLPEFRVENLGEEGSWHDVAAVSELKEGGTTYLEADGRNLFVFKHGEEIRAFDGRCPHRATNIPRLALEGEVLTCPEHEWKFDIESGACIEKGNRPLRRFESRVEEGRLLVMW